MNRPPIVIYCDFDGTVTQDDVIDVLLTELADPSWRLIETEWQQGRIGSRECLAQQIPLIRGGWKAIEARLQHMSLDPTFPAFASWCQREGLPLRIVSDGLTRVITTLLARAHVTVEAIWANHLDESPLGELAIRFPYALVDGPCLAGLCKCQVIARHTGNPLRVVIGDGRSDWCWGERADWLFAKSHLLAHCRAQAIACTPFENFDTIRLVLRSWLDQKRSAHRPMVLRSALAHVR